MGVSATKAALDAVADAAVDGRECVRLITAAYGRAVERTQSRSARVMLRDARQALRMRQDITGPKLTGGTAAGKIAMLGVAGRRGCVLWLEAASLPGTGELRFNSAAGSMAQDAASNASVALRARGVDLQGMDLYLNVTGGGQVDGPSAGLAMALVMLSCLTGRPLRQDIAVTGEISLHGDVLPVGGLHEKISAACRLGAQIVLIPSGQSAPGMQEVVRPVSNLKEAAEIAFGANVF